MTPVPDPVVNVALHDLAKPQQTAQAVVEGLCRDLGLQAERAAEIGWAAQELVGNALRHATAPIVLLMHPVPAWVTVAVADGLPVPFDPLSHRAPAPELTLEALDALDADAPELEHGRGLAAVAEVSDGRLGSALYPGCKTVWFTVPAPPWRGPDSHSGGPPPRRTARPSPRARPHRPGPRPHPRPPDRY